MHIYRNILILTFVAAFIGCTSEQVKVKNDSELSFFNNPRTKINSKFENLSVNEIRPNGWIKLLMEQDVTEGFVSQLDVLVPKLMGDDLFNTARRKNANDIPNVGTQTLTGAEWEISMQWWAAETQANWWDGYLRTAYMTNNKEAISKINTVVKYLLSTQDEDGYLGIYTKEMRYKHNGSNGELWSQTVLFRMLLGYYEYTADQKVLDAVVSAMSVTMSEYNEDKRSPFDVNIDYGGVTHGLMLTDVCETLYRITNDKKYLDYAVFLYKDFSEYPINRAFNDVVYAYLLEDSLYQSHSAHTYEHLRSLLLAYKNTGYPELENAFEKALNKLSYTILPSGAGFGDEWLGSKKSDVDSSAAEFCGMLELQNFYFSALQKTGEVKYADNAEKILFNAMLGARAVNGKSITYCKTDNCYTINRMSPHSGYKEEDMRYKYSPTHADAAVCCNPSYGRSFPYYVSNMWMKTDDGIAAVLYGPSTVSTTIKNTEVEITEVTNYPYSDEIEFAINASKDIEFTFYVRKPNWSDKLIINCEGASIVLKNGFYEITKIWSKEDLIQVAFSNPIHSITTNSEKIALQKGALVYGYEIPSKIKIVKEWKIEGFTDHFALPTDTSYQSLSFSGTDSTSVSKFQFVATPSSNDSLWVAPQSYLIGNMYNQELEQLEEVKLIPMGNTVLRKVAFEITNND